MGQVRISKRNPQRSKKNVFTNPFLKIKFKKLKFFLDRPGCCKRLEAESQRLLSAEDGPPLMPAPRAQLHVEEEEEKAKAEDFTSAIPPKNALLLMRCRSAPQRDVGAEESTTAVVKPSACMKSQPVTLTRCRSEPAWMAAKMTALEEHNSFWNAAKASRIAGAGSD